MVSLFGIRISGLKLISLLTFKLKINPTVAAEN